MIAGNFYLTDAQMKKNAKEFYDYMINRGFNSFAVCAMLGNIETESGVNPAIWENLNFGNLKGGYGLTQWTPATKVRDWLKNNQYDYDSGVGQMERIIFERNNNEQWIATSAYPLSFTEFANYTNSNMSDEDICIYLANAFLRNYERPENKNQPIRGKQAYKWFLYFGAVSPEPSEPSEPVEPNVPVEGFIFDYIYLINNKGLICIGQEYLYITIEQCVLFNKDFIIKLRKEVDSSESIYRYIGYDVYKRVVVK